MSNAPTILDLTGYRCPIPVIRLEASLRKLPDGAQLTVFADDPIAAIDIPLACSEGDHGCERLPDQDGVCVFQVTRGGKA